MKNIVVLVALVAIAEGASVNRIIGGETATPGQFKYQASLRSQSYHFCGATILSRRTLATAAHCNYSIDGTVATVGTTTINDDSAKSYPVEAFIIHEQYNTTTFVNDVALVILAEDIEFDDLVGPLPLASGAPSNGERVTASGWGYSNGGSIPKYLKWMQMNVVGSSDCAQMSGKPVEGKICTLEEGYAGVCRGDDGGPLVNDKGELVGITSHIYDLCASGTPDFFTDVYYYRDWIEQHLI